MRSKNKTHERKGRYIAKDYQRLGWDRSMERSTRQILKEDTRIQKEDAVALLEEYRQQYGPGAWMHRHTMLDNSEMM